MAKVLTILSAAALCAGSAAGAEPVASDTFLTRLKVLALIETLNAELLAAHSATLTLESWCADHGLAPDTKLHALRIKGVEKPITPEQRQRLKIGESEPVKYRRVSLACGEHVLSEADNWYVPARLTREMNKLLEETDTPFGRVVQPLHPTRETFAASLLWQPLETGWEMKAQTPDHPGEALHVPNHLFEHRAVLFDQAHVPFSEVNEIYTRAILDFMTKD